MTTKYWVTMTDKFMSGWGRAENKINKYILECDSYQEAEIVRDNAMNRSEMKYINITSTKPSYNKNRYLMSFAKKPSRMYEPHGFCKSKYD
jgi:hypothetical protein